MTARAQHSPSMRAAIIQTIVVIAVAVALVLAVLAAPSRADAALDRPGPGHSLTGSDPDHEEP